MKITLQGMDDAQKQLDAIQRGTEALNQQQALVGTRLPYGWGQEFGRHRKSGRLARRGGPSMYLHRAVETMQADAQADIAEGLNKVTRPGPWVVRRLGRWARRLARVNAPRRRGKLRRSIRVEMRSR